MIWTLAERVGAPGIIIESNHHCVSVGLFLQRFDAAFKVMDLILQVVDILISVVVVWRIYPLREPAVSHIMGVLQLHTKVHINKYV